MEKGIAVLLFFLNIFDDALGVFFARRVVAGKAIQAAVLSGILTFVISISVIKYVENRWYLIPIISGSMIGTFVAIKLDKYLKRRANAKKKKKADTTPLSAPKKISGTGKRRNSLAKSGEAQCLAQTIRTEDDTRSDKAPSKNRENPLQQGNAD